MSNSFSSIGVIGASPLAAEGRISSSLPLGELPSTRRALPKVPTEVKAILPTLKKALSLCVTNAYEAEDKEAFARAMAVLDNLESGDPSTKDAFTTKIEQEFAVTAPRSMGKSTAASAEMLSRLRARSLSEPGPDSFPLIPPGRPDRPFFPPDVLDRAFFSPNLAERMPTGQGADVLRHAMLHNHQHEALRALHTQMPPLRLPVAPGADISPGDLVSIDPHGQVVRAYPEVTGVAAMVSHVHTGHEQGVAVAEADIHPVIPGIRTGEA